MMKWERARIEYKGCKVFNDGYGGRLYSERGENGEATRCCLGAYEGDPEWPEYCEACKSCKKFIDNVRGDNV